MVLGTAAARMPAHVAVSSRRHATPAATPSTTPTPATSADTHPAPQPPAPTPLASNPHQIQPLTLAALVLFSFLAASSPALAEEAASAEPRALLNNYEVLLLTVPVLLYAMFNIWRSKFNPRAKISDFLYFIGAVVVFGNIISILVFKIRFY